MEKWSKSVAVITGANSGIGFGILKKFAGAGITVVGLDVKTETIAKFKQENSTLKVYSLICDVTDDEATELAFEWIDEHFGGVDILVNNAGALRGRQTLDFNHPMADLAFVINLNFTAYVRCARLAFKSMVARGFYGYIININAVAGHSIEPASMYNVYCGTKYAITATTEVIRQELAMMNNLKIRVASVSPGLVKTNLLNAGNVPEDVQESIFDSPYLTADDFAEIVAVLLTMPYHISINELTVRATGAPL